MYFLEPQNFRPDSMAGFDIKWDTVIYAVVDYKFPGKSDHFNSENSCPNFIYFFPERVNTNRLPRGQNYQIHQGNLIGIDLKTILDIGREITEKT